MFPCRVTYWYYLFCLSEFEKCSRNQWPKVKSGRLLEPAVFAPTPSKPPNSFAWFDGTHFCGRRCDGRHIPLRFRCSPRRAFGQSLRAFARSPRAVTSLRADCHKNFLRPAPTNAANAEDIIKECGAEWRAARPRDDDGQTWKSIAHLGSELNERLTLIIFTHEERPLFRPSGRSAGARIDACFGAES